MIKKFYLLLFCILFSCGKPVNTEEFSEEVKSPECYPPTELNDSNYNKYYEHDQVNYLKGNKIHFDITGEDLENIENNPDLEYESLDNDDYESDHDINYLYYDSEDNTY